jgi:hypothetical protein
METFVFKPFGRLRFHFWNRGNYSRRVPTNARGPRPQPKDARVPTNARGPRPQPKDALPARPMHAQADRCHRNRQLTLTAQPTAPST